MLTEDSSATGLRHMVASAHDVSVVLAATHKAGAWHPSWALSLRVFPLSLSVYLSCALPYNLSLCLPAALQREQGKDGEKGKADRGG